MTQCSFIGSVAFALRCARRSRFTTLSRIFPPSLSVSLALSVSRSPRRPCFSLVSPFRLSSFLFPRQLPLFHATFPAVQPLSDASFSRKIAWHSLLIPRSTTYRWHYFSKDTPASLPNYSEKYADIGLSIIYDIARFFRRTSLIRSVGINERAMPYTHGPSENWLEHYQRTNNNYRFPVTICDTKYKRVDNESKIGNSLRNKVLYKINHSGKLTVQKPRTSFPKLGSELIIVYIETVRLLPNRT